MTPANLALVLFDADRHDEARRLLDDCIPILVEGVGDDRPDSAEFFAMHGLLHLDDDPQRAMARLERAFDLGERSGLPQIRSLPRFALAQGLWRQRPGERGRARELALAAATDAAAAGRESRRRKVVAWLEEHAPSDMPPAPDGADDRAP